MRKNKLKFIVHGNSFDKAFQNITKLIDRFSYSYKAFKYVQDPSEIYDNPFQK